MLIKNNNIINKGKIILRNCEEHFYFKFGHFLFIIKNKGLLKETINCNSFKEFNGYFIKTVSTTIDLRTNVKLNNENLILPNVNLPYLIKKKINQELNEKDLEEKFFIFNNETEEINFCHNKKILTFKECWGNLASNNGFNFTFYNKNLQIYTPTNSSDELYNSNFKVYFEKENLTKNGYIERKETNKIFQNEESKLISNYDFFALLKKNEFYFYNIPTKKETREKLKKELKIEKEYCINNCFIFENEFYIEFIKKGNFTLVYKLKNGEFKEINKIKRSNLEIKKNFLFYKTSGNKLILENKKEKIEIEDIFHVKNNIRILKENETILLEEEKKLVIKNKKNALQFKKTENKKKYDNTLSFYERNLRKYFFYNFLEETIKEINLEKYFSYSDIYSYVYNDYFLIFIPSKNSRKLFDIIAIKDEKIIKETDEFPFYYENFNSYRLGEIAKAFLDSDLKENKKDSFIERINKKDR